MAGKNGLKTSKTMTICNANETSSTFAQKGNKWKAFEITNFSVEDRWLARVLYHDLL